jgi:hypothetical protein
LGVTGIASRAVTEQTYGRVSMSHTLDVELHDTEQFDEIQLLGELIVLASEAAEDLDLETIDATLLLGGTARLPEQRCTA